MENGLNKYIDRISELSLDSDLEKVCTDLIISLFQTTSGQAAFLTVTSLKSLVGREIPTELVLYAANLLTNDNIGALEAHLLFSDGDYETEIEKSEWAEAMQEGAFVHPQSGDTIKDFEQYLFPFYSLSKDFSAGSL